ncbi:VanZ family protein [Microbacterium sp. HD4P20]|uniref:VanZ family protein n=1 Tax=Microbacterium sp. HD4P20 TaxID=2864874 RepID=UPI001C642907|nr:VanZ family protein [Microbacterium sp. HD4P20]MCP2638091.1 VanZ family protein [Microbacterium sp. HD4P20]
MDAEARVWRDARLWLVVYVVALALVAFWPVPVDRGAQGLLAAITRAVPFLTYDVIETAANVVLFVPLGALLALVLPRRAPVVLGIALAATVVIEVAQAVLLPERTPSLRDILANLCGAAVGLGVVLLLRRRQRPVSPVR